MYLGMIFLSLYCDMARNYFVLCILIVREKFGLAIGKSGKSLGNLKSSTSGSPACCLIFFTFCAYTLKVVLVVGKF